MGRHNHKKTNRAAFWKRRRQAVLDAFDDYLIVYEKYRISRSSEIKEARRSDAEESYGEFISAVSRLFGDMHDVSPEISKDYARNLRWFADQIDSHRYPDSSCWSSAIWKINDDYYSHYRMYDGDDENFDLIEETGENKAV